MQALQGHRTKVENKAFPAAWEFLEGGLCLALSCHCPVPALPGAAVSPPQGCWACPSEPKHWSGASGISQVGQDPTHSLATAVYECVRRVYVCVCEHVCYPASLHPPRGPPSTLRFKILPRIVHLGESLGVNQCKLGGEIFLSCRVGIFYRLKVDQFFNTSKRKLSVYTHEIYIYMYDNKYWNYAFCAQPRPADAALGSVSFHHSEVL